MSAFTSCTTSSAFGPSPSFAPLIKTEKWRIDSCIERASVSDFLSTYATRKLAKRCSRKSVSAAFASRFALCWPYSWQLTTYVNFWRTMSSSPSPDSPSHRACSRSARSASMIPSTVRTSVCPRNDAHSRSSRTRLASWKSSCSLDGLTPTRSRKWRHSSGWTVFK